MIRPRRSLLFSPGANARALEKAKGLPADGLIFDLEDSVGEEEKSASRERVAAALRDEGYGRRERLVRINGPGSVDMAGDLAAIVPAGPDGILVPKITGTKDLQDARAGIANAGGAADIALWLMIETPRAILEIAEIARKAADPAVNCAGFVLGTNDIARETRAKLVPGRAPMLSWISQCVLAARAYGLSVIDSVFNDIRNDDGLRAECEQGALMGMDGKTVIHPGQIAIVNEVFAPSQGEIEEARRIVAAFEEPENRNKGVISLDGRMVEQLHAEMARRTLAIADAITSG